MAICLPYGKCLRWDLDQGSTFALRDVTVRPDPEHVIVTVIRKTKQSNCVSVHTSATAVLKERFSLQPRLEPLVVPPSLVECLQPVYNAIKRGEPSVEPLIQMIIRGGRAARGISLQFLEEICAIRACLH